MTASLGINPTQHIHWAGVEMSPAMALSFERFRKDHPQLLAKWAEKWHCFRTMPPIYWHYQKKQWFWSEPPKEFIKTYITMIEGVLKAREINSPREI